MRINQTRLQELRRERLLAGPAIHNVCQIKGTLRTKTPLHIGTGEAGKNVNLVCVQAPAVGGATSRAGDEYTPPTTLPYIPGTTLRGILRSWTEAMLGPYDTGSPTGEDRDNDGDVGEPRDKRATDRAAQDLERAQRDKGELDIVSGLFGSTRWRSKVAILDAPCRGERPAAEYYGQTTRVAIDRDLGTADEGKLFGVEYVRPNTKFHVTLEACNVRGWELGLLFHALASFNDKSFPTRIGAHTGHGFGEVEWKCTAIEADGWLQQQGTYFEAWLRRQQGAPPAKVKPAEFVQKRRQEFSTMWFDLLGGA